MKKKTKKDDKEEFDLLGAIKHKMKAAKNCILFLKSTLESLLQPLQEFGISTAATLLVKCNKVTKREETIEYLKTRIPRLKEPGVPDSAASFFNLQASADLTGSKRFKDLKDRVEASKLKFHLEMKEHLTQAVEMELQLASSKLAEKFIELAYRFCVAYLTGTLNMTPEILKHIGNRNEISRRIAYKMVLDYLQKANNKKIEGYFKYNKGKVVQFFHTVINKTNYSFFEESETKLIGTKYENHNTETPSTTINLTKLDNKDNDNDTQIVINDIIEKGNQIETQIEIQNEIQNENQNENQIGKEPNENLIIENINETDFIRHTPIYKKTKDSSNQRNITQNIIDRVLSAAATVLTTPQNIKNQNIQNIQNTEDIENNENIQIIEESTLPENQNSNE